MDSINLDRIFGIPPYAFQIRPAKIIDLSVIGRIIQNIHDEVIGKRLSWTLLILLYPLLFSQIATPFSVPSKSGQLEYQHKRDIVLLTGYIIQYLQECRSSDYALSGFPRIAVFSGYFKVLIIRILAEAFLLCLQAVPFCLSYRGDSRVDIAFLSSHRIPPFGCSSSHSTPRNFIMSCFDLFVSALFLFFPPEPATGILLRMPGN